MVSTLRLGYMAGEHIARHSTTPCGDILTTRGTTGIGICATTLITGALDTIIHTIMHIITIRTIVQRIRHSIALTTSLVEAISI